MDRSLVDQIFSHCHTSLSHITHIHTHIHIHMHTHTYTYTGTRANTRNLVKMTTWHTRILTCFGGINHDFWMASLIRRCHLQILAAWSSPLRGFLLAPAPALPIAGCLGECKAAAGPSSGSVHLSQSGTTRPCNFCRNCERLVRVSSTSLERVLLWGFLLVCY